jgi:hypothetical protein
MDSLTKKKGLKKEPKYVPEYKCKRCKKSHTMWVEQVYFKIEKIEKTIEELILTVNYIKDYLDIKSKDSEKNDKK